jgi:hypothetical protein
MFPIWTCLKKERCFLPSILPYYNFGKFWSNIRGVSQFTIWVQFGKIGNYLLVGRAHEQWSPGTNRTHASFKNTDRGPPVSDQATTLSLSSAYKKGRNRSQLPFSVAISPIAEVRTHIRSPLTSHRFAPPLGDSTCTGELPPPCFLSLVRHCLMSATLVCSSEVELGAPSPT